MKNLIIIIVLFTSTNLHSQWLQISVPTTSGLNNAFFVDENIGYIVGGGDFYGYPNSTDGIILKTTDAGINWEIIYSQNNISLNYIFIINANIYVYGRDAFSQPLQITSNDDGLNWMQTTPNFSTNMMQFSDDIIYLYDYENNFSKLKKIENNIITTIATDVGVFGVNHNELIYVNNYFNTIRKSNDYGQTWQELDNYPTGFGQNQSSHAVIKPFGNKIVIHHTYPPHTVFSMDNGINWTSTVDDVETYITKIINETTIYSISTTNIAITQNLINWQYLLEDINQKRNIYFYNNNLGFVVGDNGLLYRTENGGLSINENKILENKIKIFPNPVKNNIKLEFIDIKIKKIELISINGELIKSYNSNFTELEICNVSKGSYILKIETENGFLNKKVLIE